MAIPTRSVQVQPFTPGGDSHGRTDAWGPAEPVLIYGWGPGETVQPIEGNRRPAETLLDVYAPAGTVTVPRSRWHLGGVYEQVGEVQDFAQGPWWAAGVRIRVRKVGG